MIVKQKGAAKKSKIPSLANFQLIILILGALWLGPRIYAAVTSTSTGLMADAVMHSLKVLFGVFVYLSLRAADKADALLFPHGKGKFEALANAAVALSLLVSAIVIIVLGCVRLVDPIIPENSEIGILFLSFAFLVNWGTFIWSAPHEKSGKNVARYWRMKQLINTVTAGLTVVCIYLAQLGGGLERLDAVAAIMIGATMVWLSVKIFKDSIWELSDRALEEDIQLSILRSLAENMDGFDELKDVKTRRVGGQPVIEIWLGFHKDRSWSDIVDQCTTIETFVASHVHGATVAAIPRVANAEFKRSDEPLIDDFAQG